MSESNAERLPAPSSLEDREWNVIYLVGLLLEEVGHETPILRTQLLEWEKGAMEELQRQWDADAEAR